MLLQSIFFKNKQNGGRSMSDTADSQKTFSVEGRSLQLAEEDDSAVSRYSPPTGLVHLRH